MTKRRYECKSCHKSFFENNSIVNKFARKTRRLYEFIIEQLRDLQSISDISKKTGINHKFISRMLPCFAVTNYHLPRVLCIDEFKGNAGKDSKYQVILIDGEAHNVIDVLECRKKHFLCDYFKRFSKSERDKVEYLVTDLWETYKDISRTYLKNAKVVADRFNYIRYACNAVNAIRIDVQKQLPTKERKYFKHSRKLLLSRQCNLTEQKRTELSYILINYSENLRVAYMEKEALLDIIHSDEDSKIKVTKFSEWIKRNLLSDIPELQECAKTYSHWYAEIKNSLEVPYSNGPTEGFNNKIKVLKRISFGIRKFTNLKARILMLNRG